MLTHILDWIYPPTCLICQSLLPVNKPRRFFCLECVELLETIEEPVCDRCGKPMNPESEESQKEVITCGTCRNKELLFTSNQSLFLYDEILRDLLHDMKFRSKKAIATGLGNLWAAFIKGKYGNSYDFQGFSLAPVPMHPKKRRERGFNAAEIFATELSRVLAVPLANHLVRTRDTLAQAGLHPKAREENVQDVFAISPGADPLGGSYILIDDIFTTGATLNECAKVLVSSGAKQVKCMTLSISVKNNIEGAKQTRG